MAKVKKEYERKRQEKKEKKRVKRKGKRHKRDIGQYERNRREVAKRISGGRYDLVMGSGWGFIGDFWGFMIEIGIIMIVGKISGGGYERVMVEVGRLVMVYMMKGLIGISSMNKVTSSLFKEIALMKVIGFTVEEIKEGISRRGKGKSKPMHKDVVADMLERLTEKEREYVYNEAIKKLAKEGLIKEDEGKYILDASRLETTKKYEDRGMVIVKEKHLNKKGEIVEIEVRKYGWKLIMIQGVRSGIVVATKVVKINNHENEYTLEMIKKAQRNIGVGVMKLLLIDRGFIDGINLWNLKNKYNIDFIIPSKEGMEVTDDARSLVRVFSEDLHIGEIKYQNGKVRTKVYGVEELLTYDQYGDEQHNRENFSSKSFEPNPINAVVVKVFNEEEYEEGEEKVFLTSLDVCEPIKVVKNYCLRSLIENIGFRELKQGWLIGKFPNKTKNGVFNHIFLTLTIFSISKAFQTKETKKILKGIRRQRDEHFRLFNKVVVFAENYYAIFDIEEFAYLCGNPPNIMLRASPENLDCLLQN